MFPNPTDTNMVNDGGKILKWFQGLGLDDRVNYCVLHKDRN